MANKAPRGASGVALGTHPIGITFLTNHRLLRNWINKHGLHLHRAVRSWRQVGSKPSGLCGGDRCFYMTFKSLEKEGK